MEGIFSIVKIDLAEYHKLLEHYNLPHKHNYEELLIGEFGQLEHFIDYNSKVIEAPFVTFIAKGKVHRIRPIIKDGNCQFWGIRFSTDFISSSIFQLYANYHDKANISLNADGCFDRLNSLCQMIYDEYRQNTPDFAVIRQLLLALFSIIESERKKQNLNKDESKKIQSKTFQNFLKLLDLHFKEVRDVNFYAEKLNMSTRNLNLICQEILHQSLSEIIESRRLTEAKNLLITTDMNMAEIAYLLGFNEKTYFTHAFKKKSGFTPSEYRKEMSIIIS